MNLTYVCDTPKFDEILFTSKTFKLKLPQYNYPSKTAQNSNIKAKKLKSNFNKKKYFFLENLKFFYGKLQIVNIKKVESGEWIIEKF